MSKATKELNSVDLQVKRMMLEYPDLFPARIKALEYLFCTIGTGAEWYVDGTLKFSDDEKPYPTKMEQAEPYDFEAIGKFSDDTSNALDENTLVRLAYENINRRFREENIDYLCSTNSHNLGNDMSFVDVYPMSWQYSKMCQAAEMPDQIAKEWRDAVHEFIHWYLPKVNGKYGCWDDENNCNDSSMIKDPDVRKNYEYCLKVKDMLQTDEDRKSAKTTQKFMKKMTDKLLKEIDND